jgi:3-isopropylmalate/(R)-2-methylmalate dehydratase large subunit
VVVGTDSHTSTAGAVGCLAFGVGSSDMAAAWLTRDVRFTVPESVRIELTGRLEPGVTAKDVMLTLFASALVQEGGASGRVLEFTGDGIAGLSLDERATLTNLSVEAGALTGIVPLDARAARELAALRGGLASHFESRAVIADPGAGYAAELRLDLASVEPMLALPGDPKRVRPLSEQLRAAPLRIDTAYAGSCTGGKRSDMDFYASVFGRAAARGQRIAPHVKLFVQVASERVLSYARERGYLEIFEAVGATLLGPACGACIAAGPGTSRSKEEVTISAASRNFPGRSGPGQVILANPFVVAASALSGFVAAPSETIS